MHYGTVGFGELLIGGAFADSADVVPLALGAVAVDVDHHVATAEEVDIFDMRMGGADLRGKTGGLGQVIDARRRDAGPTNSTACGRAVAAAKGFTAISLAQEE